MTEAFEGRKREFGVSVSLCVPCVSDKFVLECDASASGVRAVLSASRGEELLPVAFFSKQLRGAQTRYSAQELEGVALVEAVEHLAYYLYLTRFVVVTDHKALETLRTAQQHNRRLHHWALKLAVFNAIPSRPAERGCGLFEPLSQ